MKKVLCLLAALCLLLMTVAAFAEEEEEVPRLYGPAFTTDVYDWVANPNGAATPSITSDDMTAVMVNIEDTDFAIFIVPEESAAEWYLPEVAAIGAHVSAGNPVMTYFDAAINAETQGHFAAGTDLNSLICYEIVPVDEIHYKTMYGDIATIGEFATIYPMDVEACAIVGFWKGTREDGTNIIEWYVLDTAVREDGKLNIIFRQEVMEVMEQEGQCIMVVVSNPIEA